MSPKQFYYSVVKMREKQRLYERNHAPSVLREARDWERVIDAEIDRVKIVLQEKEKQLTLDL